MNEDKSLRWSRRLGIVPRWVVVPTIQHQTVAEHCFHVARTALWLVRLLPHMGEKGMDLSAYEHDILIEALRHDDDEAATGDNPSPTKGPKDFTTYNTLKLVVKVADMLESLAFLHEEMSMGNRRVQEVTDDAYQIYRRAWEALQDKHPSDGMRAFTASHVLTKYLDTLNCKHPGLEAKE